MNSKQKKTLQAIFAGNGRIDFADIESLLLACGATKLEGNGSRVRFDKDAEIVQFHRPHPGREALPYQVRDARNFLAAIGVLP